MTKEFMPIYLSLESADSRWGKDALLSASNDGMTIHLHSSAKLGAVQRAAHKLDSQGIKQVALAGNDWDLERCWSFWQGFRSPKGQHLVQWPTLSQTDQQELERRLKIIDWVRDTINLPAEELSPNKLTKRVIDLIHDVASEHMSYKMLKGETLREKEYMGLYTVGRGSTREAVFLSMDYNPSGNPEEPVFACLVGKGITFDSGGYSLKESSFMNSMKADMGGAALVSGALAMAIARGLNKRVKLFLACADNMVSGNAFKLGDIIHYRNGKTVEVMNTDAEGRLVLADGLIDADAQHAQFIIDCATLTGAAKTALGTDYHALLSFDDALSDELLASAKQENELFWRLPLAEFHRSQLPSAFADLNNIAGAAYSAGASTAAAFLSHFVKDYQQNWLHIDCSATYQKSAVEQWSTGATGLGVRTLANFLLKKSA